MKTFKEFLAEVFHNDTKANAKALALKYTSAPEEAWHEFTRGDRSLNRKALAIQHSPYKKHLDDMVKDPDSYVRAAIAINSPYKDHVVKLTKDKDGWVRNEAIKRMNYDGHKLK